MKHKDIRSLNLANNPTIAPSNAPILGADWGREKGRETPPPPEGTEREMAKAEGLSNRRVAALVPTTTEFIEWDGNVGGFGVRVSPGGTKAFILKYKIAGRSRAMRLGTFGDITCEQARVKATKARGMVADGIDPSADRDAQRNAAALDDVWAKFVTVNTPHWSSRTVGEYQRYFSDHIRPAFGNRPPNTIERSSVAALHHRLRETPVAANRVLSTLSSFMSFCGADGVCKGENPCKHIRRFDERPRERVLNDAEIARLGAALEGYNGNVFVKAAIRLILLIGCRKMEILGMRWAEVDLDAGTARLPETKTGARTVYLGAEAVDIMRDLP